MISFSKTNYKKKLFVRSNFHKQLFKKEIRNTTSMPEKSAPEDRGK